MKVNRNLELRTGCRLHFGLMELCPDEVNCFAGLGLMLDSPSVHLELGFGSRRTESIEDVEIAASEELKPRIVERLVAWASHASCLLPDAIRVRNALPLHNGLGAGTQTACAVATLLHAFSQASDQDLLPVDWQSSEQLIGSAPQKWLVDHAKRGLRSAIGVQGFLSGGLVFDQGYLPSRDPNGSDFQNRPVETQVAYLNPTWRVVLISPNQKELVAGEREAGMINRIGNHANPNRDAMRELADTIMGCARSGADLQEFAAQLDRYTEYAGRVFASMQGGQYSSQAVDSAVVAARRAGLVGVGQSSWGPTVFGFSEDSDGAEKAKHSIEAEYRQGKCTVSVSKPAMSGAQYRWTASKMADEQL